MATRQRTRKPSPPKASAGPTATASNEPSRDTQLSATFRPGSLEGSSDESSQTGTVNDVPKATFIGEQLVYLDRGARIAEAAYFRAQQRGFAPGYELEDWLGAEQEVDALFAAGQGSTAK